MSRTSANKLQLALDEIAKLYNHYDSKYSWGTNYISSLKDKISGMKFIEQFRKFGLSPALRLTKMVLLWLGSSVSSCILTFLLQVQKLNTYFYARWRTWILSGHFYLYFGLGQQTFMAAKSIFIKKNLLNSISSRKPVSNFKLHPEYYTRLLWLYKRWFTTRFY